MSAPEGGEGRHAARPNDPVQATDSGASDDTLEVRPSPGQTVEVRPAVEGVPSRPTVSARDDEQQHDERADADAQDDDVDTRRSDQVESGTERARPLLGPGSTGPRTAPSTDAVTSVEAPELDTMPRPASP